MQRISGHAIDGKHLTGCKPIRLNIGIYIDGYGAKLSAAELYEIGHNKLYDHLLLQSNGDLTLQQALYDKFNTPDGPEIYAEMLSFCLALVELNVVARMEARYRAAGTQLRPNALLVNQSNPLDVEIGARKHNLLEALFPISEEQSHADHYLSVSCKGAIYAPKKIDRQRQIRELKAELSKANRNGDTERKNWINRNLETVPKGVLHYYNSKERTIGKRVDFDFTERFFDAVAERVGDYADWGETKVHWGTDLRDFGEKGVDCNLIMDVMDDLHAGTVDVFVIMTKDMDFFPLIERLRHEGKAVFLCGLKGNASHHLKEKASRRLIEAAGRDQFLDLASSKLLESLPSVFMTAKGSMTRKTLLQWTFLAMLHERRAGS
ncbi:NYN domain-containing protein [Falsiroseomonas ponticola]|uniref:NYN domain-containing protein n=1 Tax=Falsiroseomonas ponticola TaxID=2786951 RepID=UPI001933CCD7|nr:NYN domain-containing protein [Roseomonas ponticola]